MKHLLKFARTVDTENIHELMKNWTSKTSQLKIFLNTTFTRHTYSLLTETNKEKIKDAVKFLYKLSELKGFEIVTLDESSELFKSSSLDLESLYLIEEKLLELIRKSDCIISIGCLDYIEQVYSFKNKMIHWLLLDDPVDQFLDSTNIFLYGHPNLNIYSPQSDFMSSLYDILKDY